MGLHKMIEASNGLLKTFTFLLDNPFRIEHNGINEK